MIYFNWPPGPFPATQYDKEPGGAGFEASSSHKTDQPPGRRAVCAEKSRRQIDEVHDRHRRTDRQCEPRKQERDKTGEQLVAGSQCSSSRTGASTAKS